MDSKVMDLINREIKRLPARKKVRNRDSQYEAAKKYLCDKFPGQEEYQYICRAIARKYGL